LGDAEEVGDVPDLLRLLSQRRDERGVRVTERVDRNAAGKIEIALAVGADEPSAFAPLKGEVRTCVGRHQRCDQNRLQAGKTGNAERKGAARRYERHSLQCIGAADPVNTRQFRALVDRSPQFLGKTASRLGERAACFIKDSCRRESAYCSLPPVEYDISCGGL